MDDREVVALLIGRDARGLEAAYATYSNRIHDYCRWMLRGLDGEAAADVVHDTFLVAYERADQLRDPDRLRPWLYAVARNECLRVLRARKRTTVLEDGAWDALLDQNVDETMDVTTGLRNDELRSLVHAAMEGLTDRDREVLELALRHSMDATEVASALRVPLKQSHAMLSRARQQFERALGALVVAQTGQGRCAALHGMLADWNGTFTPLVRKRIARHIDGCAVCGEEQRHQVSASALLGIMPIAAAPALLQDRVLADAFNPDLVSHRTALGDRAEPFDAEGFPIPLDHALPGAVPRGADDETAALPGAGGAAALGAAASPDGEGRKRGGPPGPLIAGLTVAAVILGVFGALVFLPNGETAQVTDGRPAAPITTTTPATESASPSVTATTATPTTSSPTVTTPPVKPSTTATPTFTPTPTRTPSRTPTGTATPTTTAPQGTVRIDKSSLTMRPGGEQQIKLTAGRRCLVDSLARRERNLGHRRSRRRHARSGCRGDRHREGPPGHTQERHEDHRALQPRHCRVDDHGRASLGARRLSRAGLVAGCDLSGRRAAPAT